MNLTKKCKYCNYITDNGKRLGGHMTNCKYNPNYEKIIERKRELGYGRKLSDETKEKISKSMKKYLKDNPDKVPYLLNHSRKESYPEKYFTNIFDENNCEYIKGYRIGLYELDFAIINKKIDIEIDGDQHYLDEKIIKSDISRNKYLKDKGWDVIRVKWSEYQKMDRNGKEKYINDLILYIDNISKTKPNYTVNYNMNYCICGKVIYKGSKRCVKCNSIRKRKVERPNFTLLKKEVKDMGYLKTGKKYGVSDNTIRKWLKFYKNNI